MHVMPLHERIRTDIENQILAGVVTPGERIPSEAELMKQYKCARMTVNKALSALTTAGLLYRNKRAGTCVAQPRTQSMVLDIPDLPVAIAARGQRYQYSLVSRRIRRATGGSADERSLAGSGRILFVNGIHLADGRPIAYEERLINLKAVPEIEEEDFSVEPPGSWLLHHIPWTEAENRIGAVGAGPEWASYLQVEVGSACLTVERRTWRASEGITLVRQQFVAGAYELVARFGRAQLPNSASHQDSERLPAVAAHS